LLWKTDASGSSERKYGSGRKCMPHTNENIDAVEDEELVLSQEDASVPEKYS